MYVVDQTASDRSFFRAILFMRNKNVYSFKRNFFEGNRAPVSLHPPSKVVIGESYPDFAWVFWEAQIPKPLHLLFRINCTHAESPITMMVSACSIHMSHVTHNTVAAFRHLCTTDTAELNTQCRGDSYETATLQQQVDFPSLGSNCHLQLLLKAIPFCRPWYR